MMLFNTLILQIAIMIWPWRRQWSIVYSRAVDYFIEIIGHKMRIILGTCGETEDIHPFQFKNNVCCWSRTGSV